MRLAILRESATVLHNELNKVNHEVSDKYYSVLEDILTMCAFGSGCEAMAPNAYISCSNLHTDTIVHLGEDNRLNLPSNTHLASITINYPEVEEYKGENPNYHTLTYQIKIITAWNKEVRDAWLKLLNQDFQKIIDEDKEKHNVW